MIKYLKFIFGNTVRGKKIFEKLGYPQPNFKIVATHIRKGENGQNYMLDNVDKLPLLIEKWCFEPGETVGRCGYDYQILLTNGDIDIPIFVCFRCNTFVFNGLEKYKTSRKQIMALLKEDFKVM